MQVCTRGKEQGLNNVSRHSIAVRNIGTPVPGVPNGTDRGQKYTGGDTKSYL